MGLERELETMSDEEVDRRIELERRVPVVLVIVAIVDSMRLQQELNSGVLELVHPRCTRSSRKGGKVACSIRKWSGYFLKRDQGQATLRSKYFAPDPDPVALTEFS
jgi:hypothetical protein